MLAALVWLGRNDWEQAHPVVLPADAPCGSRGGIRPQFGALFGLKKRARAGENLFALDSALLQDLSGSLRSLD